MDRKRQVAIAAGGVLGASARWLLTAHWVDHSTFPWHVFFVNVAGCVVIGLLLAEEWKHRHADLLLRDFGAIGFCGGFTTFSTFSVQTAHMLHESHVGLAVTYVVSSIVIGIFGAVIAAWSLRRVRALMLPVEGHQ